MNVFALQDKRASELSHADTRILIVDDSPSSSEKTLLFLAEHGYAHCETVVNTAQLPEKVKIFSPDLIIFNLSMSEGNGLDCCRALRETDHAFRFIPVLVLSDRDSVPDHVRFLENGATEILLKPCDQDILLSKINQHVQNYKTLQMLEQQRAQSIGNDGVARMVQTAILPSETEIKAMESRTGMNIHHMLIPSDEIGGDIWGIKSLDDHRLAVYLFDFSGHGISASVSAYLIHSFLPQIFVYGERPDDMLALLNRHMCAVMPYGQYAVAFLAILDTQTHRLSYAAAGTHPALLTSGSRVTLLDGAGQPLGLFPDGIYTLHETVFEEDALFILHSDAIVEPGRDGVIPFTRDALTAWAEMGVRDGAEAAFQDLLRRLTSCAASIEDDLTLVLLSYAKGQSRG